MDWFVRLVTVTSGLALLQPPAATSAMATARTRRNFTREVSTTGRAGDVIRREEGGAPTRVLPPPKRALMAPTTALLHPYPAHGSINTMDMSQVWPRLATSTQTWLVEHNGEPLPGDILDEILAVTAGQRDPRWWAGESQEGETQLTDGAVDWIDETANGE